MIIYFADRQMRVLGLASTILPNGYVISEDLKTEDVETGVATFSCRVGFNDETRMALEQMTKAGNYLLRSHNGENEFYTIIDKEIDTKNKDIYIYAEDAGLDLLNEIAGEFEADDSRNAEWYINKYIIDSGFEIGINEIPSDSVHKLSWEGEETVTARLASIATQFGGYEISFSFDIKGLQITNKYVNFYAKRGQDLGVQLRLNREIDRIITTESVANLATAFVCEGGVPDNEEEPITLKGYSYDDGDFFVDTNGKLKSRKANEKWSRYVWNKEPNQLEGYEGYIVRPYSYDTTDQKTLCSHAITELKKICDMEVNYEIDISRLPDGVKIGDRVNIIDDAGEMYVSTRVLLLETSVVDQKYTATLGEHLIKTSGISQKVTALAEQFSATSQSATRALTIANTAKNIANEAQTQANTALAETTEALTKATEAETAANTAKETAENAQAKALAAEAAVDKVESSVSALETTVENAKTAADNAKIAADEATAKAEEAEAAALLAADDAEQAQTAANNAQTSAESAISTANTAISTADDAKATAESASATAEAAKLDAEQAEKDIEAFGATLETFRTTMEADYARKTDLTETEAHLQSQITQNASQISSTVSQVTIIDETANDAKSKAEAAQTAASAAQSQANQATAEAQAAQTAADNAAAAATAAQSEADTAKAAAATAQSIADKAEADLEAAKADLATVSGRVDATEEEIAAAQAAVTVAQTAANNAKADADAAALKATNAQATANTAVTNAANAQSAADEAASQAALAQQTANQAKGNAAAAQAKADEAASAAAAAQQTANEAVSNAATAQAKADQAAQEAEAAQRAADDADAKAAQAQSDLDTAKQNLADVTSRVGATEEEVAAAQEAVNTAQAAADQAKADAAAAQSLADTALTDALTAQAAANNAKTAADNAQKAADEAKAAAEKAQDDVDALTIRVTKAETDIVQTKESITLLATKAEVTQTLGGYYTMAQTDAAIKTSADGITSSVSEKIAEIEVGGRNLVVLSKLKDGYRMDASGADYVSAYSSISGLIPVKAGEKLIYTVHCIHADEGDTYWQLGFYAEDEAFISRPIMTVATTTEEKTSWTATAPENAVYARVAFPTVVKDKVKLEAGDKATDWTPAPEDVAEDIGTAQAWAADASARVTTAETTIQQLADSISALVRGENGGSLVTQDESGLYYFDISNIQESLSNTANGLDDLEGIVLDANGEIDVLKSTAAALASRTEYVRSYTDENGQPCLELGEGDSVFKVRITNTEIQFAEGTAVPTRINRQMLVIEKAMIRNELQFGDDKEVDGVWIWKRRTNGNLGLMWKGGTS